LFQIFKDGLCLDQNNANSTGNGEIGHFENYTGYNISNRKHEHQTKIVGEFGNGTAITRTCADDLHPFCPPDAENKVDKNGDEHTDIKNRQNGEDSFEVIPVVIDEIRDK